MVCLLLSAASEVEVLPEDASLYEILQGPIHFSAVNQGWQVAWSASAYNLLEVNDFATTLVGNTIKGDAVLLSGANAVREQSEEQMLQALLHSKMFRMAQPNCPQNRRRRQASTASVQRELSPAQDLAGHGSFQAVLKRARSFHHIAAANSTRQRILSSKSASWPVSPPAEVGQSSCFSQSAGGSDVGHHDQTSRCRLTRPPQRHAVFSATAKGCSARLLAGQLQPALHHGHVLVKKKWPPEAATGGQATHVEHGASGKEGASSTRNHQQQHQSQSEVCSHLKKGGTYTCTPCSSGAASERNGAQDTSCTVSESEHSSDSSGDSSNCCVPDADISIVQRPPVQHGLAKDCKSSSGCNGTAHLPGCVDSNPPTNLSRDATAFAWEQQTGLIPPVSSRNSPTTATTTTTTSATTSTFITHTFAQWGDLSVEVVARVAGLLGRLVSDVMPMYLTCSSWRRAILEDDQLLHQLLFQVDVSRPFKGQTAMQLRTPVASSQQLRLMNASGQHPALLVRAAKLGNLTALVSRARLLDASGCAEEAMRCWRRAAKAGHLEGQLVYGLGLYRGNAGLPQDAEDAYMWLLRALKQGQSSAAGGHVVDSALRSRVLAESGLCLGYLVFDGEGVKADRSEAVKYFRLAAGAGCKEAEQVLGWMYNTGQF